MSAANLGYLPRQQQQLQQLQQPKIQSNQQAYYYNPPSSSTMAALRRIVLGHLQRFQQADRERQRALAEVQQSGSGMSYRQPVVAQTISLDFHAVPPNTPTPKNYAMNFLPEGRDVVPGTSYIPLRLLLIRR